MVDFQNIEQKLKSLAKILMTIGIVIACLILFLFLIMAIELGGVMLIIGIIFSVLIILASYIGSIFIYGFGQLIENTKKE